MRYFLLIVAYWLACLNIWADIADSTQKLDEVIVTGYRLSPIQKSSINIQALSLDSVNKYGSYNLAGLLSKQAGVSMLSTGVAIAKPVIRGLYGNRVLILLNGLRFDNQQWQEEHGLGLSTVGVSKLELIKGPFGILYGTEALGGVINIVEEEKPHDNKTHSDVALLLNSNTLGGCVEAGVKKANANAWWRLRLGIENNGDYSDGHNQRVLNSRSDGYVLKSTYGFRKANWISVNNFSSSFNRFGFIFNDIYTFVTPDARWSRSMNTNPAHYVFLNVLSSENTIQTDSTSKWQVNVGLQSNQRMENEGGGAISLNMHLLTGQYIIRYEHALNAANKIIFSHLASIESNTNYGMRKIVPNALMEEANLSGFLESHLTPQLIFENGIGAGQKYIRTFATPTVNMEDKEVKPFEKCSPYYNAFTGITWMPSAQFNLKANLSTGVRVGNLAELSSDGLHEGIFTFEIGNPLLKNEQLFSANLFANFFSRYVDVSISPFYNYFLNYIYLTPVDEQWFGFPVYRYKQQDATQAGTEAQLALKPSDHFHFQLAYSGMLSKTRDGNYTPFVPAQKIVPAIVCNFRLLEQLPVQAFTNLECYQAQHQVAPLEIKTPAYQLWNMGLHTTVTKNQKTCHLAISCQNILNVAYYDHLSRFKNYGLLNIGRNFILNFKYQF